MIDYAEVLADLEERAQRLQGVISSIRELMEMPDAQPPAPVPQRKKPGPKEKVKAKVARQISRPASKGPRTGMTIREAIRTVAAEHPGTSIEVADRVQKILPEANRNSISAQIGQLVTEGHLRKDDRLIVHLAANGTAAGARA
ncbi:MAG TPA: hypothetical protein VKX25_19575 [Bryobacteraceae bacterium]|jgi:hypothetical protein|nr:hypothetical protein [Bryobacteraceae bacterium]